MEVNLKSTIALLVLANYLFLAGMGCISRPEQDSFVVLIQTKAAESRHYESRNYLRTNALEVFMAEALATNYEKASDNHCPHILSVITGIDTHFLPDPADPPSDDYFFERNSVFTSHESRTTRAMAFAIDAPPSAPERFVVFFPNALNVPSSSNFSAQSRTVFLV